MASALPGFSTEAEPTQSITPYPSPSCHIIVMKMQHEALDLFSHSDSQPLFELRQAGCASASSPPLPMRSCKARGDGDGLRNDKKLEQNQRRRTCKSRALLARSQFPSKGGVTQQRVVTMLVWPSPHPFSSRDQSREKAKSIREDP